MNNLHVLSSNLGVGVTVSTPLGENIHIDDIYRGEGHRWIECSHVGRGYYYCGDRSHRKKDCPRRTTEGTHG